MKKKIYLILLLVFSLLPNYNLQAQTSNAGFVPGNIWYSKDPFEEGDKIKIYTVLFNYDQREFSGTVVFFDKTIFLGKKDFTIGARAVKDVSIDWTVSAGDHTIFAKIENAKFLISAGKYEQIYLAGNQTEESERAVSKKIIPKTSDSENPIGNSVEGILSTGSESIENIGKLIEEKTPKIIAQPIIAAANAIENFREGIGNFSKDTKNEIKKELEAKEESTAVKENKTTKENKIEEPYKLSKPFQYIKLFFLSLVSFVFNNKFIFYGLSFLIVFFILRYLWHLIF